MNACAEQEMDACLGVITSALNRGYRTGIAKIVVECEKVSV
jgi:hypothetical protein